MIWRHDVRLVKRHKSAMALMVIISLLCVAGLAILLMVEQPHNSAQTPQKTHVDSFDTGSAKTVTGRYLLNGTVTWTRGVEQQASSDVAQPFSQLDTFSPALYNAWSASLECPITDHLVTFQEAVSTLMFNCPKQFLPAATKYFGIYDLANNHTYDQAGEAGLAATRANLDAAGAQYFGTYDSSDTNNVCEVLSLPVNVSDAAQTSLPVAFCGWQYFTRPPVESELAVMDRYAKVMPVFAFVEAGVEYRSQADDRQVSVGHQLVDHGADFVIINSPHWVQNTEAYSGKLIVYSMGNFIFDQLEVETNRSVSIDVAMNIAPNSDLERWLKLGESCRTYHDNCLHEAEQQHLAKLVPTYKFGVVAGQNGYKVVTHKADADTQKAVEQRTNWSQTCQQLGYNQCQ